jgi:pimeloyl-ACP methyl ester carboxylesterase
VAVIALVDGARIAYDDIGSGEPVVFLHAFPLNGTMWAPQTSALAAEWRCLTLDARGFGESPAQAPFTMDRYADDVVAMLDHAGIGSATVVGLSMGGYVAFALWRRAPDRVRALVLADTRATADPPDGVARRRELISLARSEGVCAVAERQLVGLLGKTTRARRPEVEATARAIAEGATVEGIVGALEALVARPDSTATLATITVPTLFNAGEEDVITPPKEARAMHEAVLGSRLEIIGRAGHLSNLEAPAAFNVVVSEFLREFTAGFGGTGLH